MSKREELFVNVMTFPNGVTHRQGSGAPTVGTNKAGSIVYNTAPTANGDTVGWICTVAGTPGTWKAFGSVAA